MFYAGLDEIHQRKVREAAPVERDVLVHVKGGIGGNSFPAGIAYRDSLRAEFKEAGKVNLRRIHV